jgi:hypothetical protein
MFKYLLALIVLLGISLTLFAETVEVKVLAVGNGKVRVDDGPYQSETVLQCEIGSTIQVEIESLENFIGWGGWGKSSDRSIKTSPKVKTIKIDKARTITAYFINSIKDNLILNGDFSLVSNLSSSLSAAEKKLQPKDAQKFIVESFDRLTAGEWYLDYQQKFSTSGNYAARTGLLILKSDWYSNLTPYDTKSLTLALGGYIGTSRTSNSKVRCLINIPCGGEYKLTFSQEIGYHTSYVFKNHWDVFVYLLDNKGRKCFEKIVNYKSSTVTGSNAKWEKKYTIEQINLPRSGVYELYFELDRPSIYDAGGTKEFGHVAYDNLSFNFVRGRGFSVIVR